MIWLLALPAAYHLLVIAAALAHRWRKPETASELPPVSILKPVRGRDPRFFEAVCSHARQDYPHFEILFGYANPDEPALEDIYRAQAIYPAARIRAIHCSASAPNGKVAVLEELAGCAASPVLLVNDSDISVEPEYLRRVVAPLADPGVGLVTCLYRANASSFPARFEALGVSTEFAASVLVARLLGMAGFALGSTMAFRADDLERIGGFAAIREYLADDYHLGRMIAATGKRVELSGVVVETNLGGESWQEVWDHQLRWSRTIRVLQRAGYLGYLVTHATFWAAAAMACGAWRPAVALLALRLVSAFTAGFVALRDSGALVRLPLVPLRDLWGFVIWATGLVGNTVVWRGVRMRLDGDGRILSPESAHGH